MNTDYQLVLEKSKKRFEVLKAIYLDTNGQSNKFSVSNEISKTTEIPYEELIHVLQHLKDEQLIHPLSMLHGGQNDIPIKILHKGVLEVEAAISKPNESTEHFPAQVFNITNNAPVSAQQIGNQNTLNVEQQSNLVEAAAEIQRLLKQLEQNYPTVTLTEKAIVAEQAINFIESNPTFKERVVQALKAVGIEAFKEAVDHPLVNILMAGIEGWQEGR
jgi:hypothetical protein